MIEKFNNMIPPSIDLEDYGTSVNNPILLNSVIASYDFCNKLAHLSEYLSYERRGSDISKGFEKPVDIYDFKISGKEFCTIYIYAYHNLNLQEVPFPFHNMGEILENLLMEEFEEDNNHGFDDDLIDAELIDYEGAAYILVSSCLQKFEEEKAGEVSLGTNALFTFAREDLEADANIEALIITEWKKYYNSKLLPHQDFFIYEFIEKHL